MNHTVIDNGWGRLILAIAVSSILALSLAWFVAPELAGFLVGFDEETDSTVPESLVLLDLIFTTLIFFGCSVLSIKIARSFAYAAALGVSLIGWAVYFWEVGGLNGMLNSEYPLWYEFAPSHIASGWLAAVLMTKGKE